MKLKRIESLAAAAVSALVCAGAVQAQITFDDFNSSEGHFNLQPTFSGSTTGLNTSSTADRVTSNGPLEGTGHQALGLTVAAGATTFRLRHLSGGGSVGANVAFTTSAATDGWIGFYLKTDQPNLTAQLWIEGPSNNGGVPKPVNNDGAWHYYEWNLDDTSGGANGWGGVAGIVGGDATVQNGSHTIDSILIRGTGFAGGEVLAPIYLDFVALNPAGSISGLLVAPCLSTPGIGGVNGPVRNGDTTANIRGCLNTLNAANGDAVYVYQTDAGGVLTRIGELTSGFSNSGTEAVPLTTALIKNRRVVATQKQNNQESCLPAAATGVLVGGGANPKVRVAFSIREDVSLTGPIGAAGGAGTSVIYWLPATGKNGLAATGSVELLPSKSWQSVAATRGPNEATPIDGVQIWNGTDSNTQLNGNFGVLDAVWFSIDDTDTGPYRIHVDELRNGSTLIQGFETSQIQFAQPSYSSTSNALLLLDGDAAWLNSRVLSTVNDRGGHSVRVSWQFKEASGTQGLRWLPNDATAGGIPYPQVDLRLPISLRVLVLPVGETTEAGPTITDSPDNATVGIGGSAAFSATATTTDNPANVTYSWIVNGVVKFTETKASGQSSSYAATGLLAGDNGTTVSVSVSDTTGSTHSDDAIIAVTPCGVPFADDDHDGDVDQLDFARFQECYAGANNPITGAGCTCFNVQNADGLGGYLAADSDVDADDLAEFLKCVTAPAVPYVEAEHPTCEGWVP